MGVVLVTVTLLITVMQGVFCGTWDVTLPQSIMGISNSCVTVLCLFEIPAEHEANLLNCSKSGVWRKGNVFGDVVLNSHNPFTNIIHGKVVGDLTKKNCTTMFYSFPKDYNDMYFFRLDCPNSLKFSFTDGVRITVQSDPLPPLLNFVSQVAEGDQVRLQCSVPVPCSSLPPSLTWLPQDSSRQEETEMLQNMDRQVTMTSTLTFIATADHHNQTIACSVSYPLTKGGSTRSSAATQRVRVLYAPRFTVATVSTSRPVSEGRTVTFKCSSDANPPVSSYTWYRDDSGKLNKMGEGDMLTLQVNWSDSGVYLCEAQTPRGSQRSNPVSLEVTTGSECLMVLPYIICGVVLVLYIITVVVGVYKYQRYFPGD
ncbi:myelin-associated glycoprotein-like isoform X2 [Mastacembelus armatus]|uniref:myelin-associated glycoprotein-like isoform X2 n=1 Tax=Mastacembelus armatus TaxID=205130 RepID=UPI000E4565F5|nr:myelin-associated glycoprotein-like isoform X2 [Mastacembelus armatus]